MEINDRHVEWAVVNRLKAMLDAPPATMFNVTQSFALFSSIVLWTKQRAWVGGEADERPQWFDEADHAARDLREALRAANVFDPPWSLSKTPPRLGRVRERDPIHLAEEHINVDFEGMTAEQFIKWLRDALAHGDARKITPIRLPAGTRNKTTLAGFKIVSPAEWGSKRYLFSRSIMLT